MAEETLKDFILKRPECVFKNPNNEYYSFINLYVFVNGETPNREASIKKGQTIWSSNDRADVFSTLISKGQAKMEKLKKRRWYPFQVFFKRAKTRAKADTQRQM